MCPSVTDLGRPREAGNARWRTVCACPGAAMLMAMAISWLLPGSAQGQSPNQSQWLRELLTPVRETRGDPGRWFDWEAAYFTTARGSSGSAGLPAAELEAMDRELRAAADALRRVPLLAEPRGFHPMLTGSIHGRWGGSGGPVIGVLTFGAWGLDQERQDRQGRRVPAGETYLSLFRFNALPPGEGLHWLKDESAEGEMFLMPEVAPPFPGTILVGRSLVVVPPGKAPPYLPVTTERVLRAHIARGAGAQEDVNQQLAARRRELEEYLSPANEAKRKAEIEEAMRGFMNANRQDEATARRRAEAIDERYIADLRAKADPPAGDPLFRGVRATREAEALLAGMSPAARAVPAWVAYDAEYGELPLRPPGSRGAAPVMRFNPAYFDRALPRTALQSMFVMDLEWPADQVARLRTRPGVVSERIHLALFQQVDWEDFARTVLK